MATIELFNPLFYKAGASGKSGVVGCEYDGSRRVVRYTTLSPSTGANHVDLTFTGNWLGNGTLPETLRFYIGTDPDSHANAGADFTYTGTLSRTSGSYDYSGSADIILLSTTIYYVWVFPASATYGWVYWSDDSGDAMLETSGSAYSTLAAENGTLGVAQTLTVTRYNEDFTHTITCAIGSATVTICEGSTATEVAWTPPLELANQIQNATKGAAALTIATYDGTTLIGSQTVTVELAVPEDIVPTVSTTWSDTSGAFDKMGTYVKLVSTLAVDAVGVGAYGSTITGATLTLGGKAYAGGAILEAGDLQLVATVSDSRGRSGSAVYTISVADYAVPSVSISAHRCLEDGTADDMGEYAEVYITGTVVEVNGCNSATLTFTYGTETVNQEYEPGAIEYTAIIPAPSVSTLALSAALADELQAPPAATMILSIGYATLDFFAGGKGIAFGTTAKKEGFTCAMDTDFSGHSVTGLPDPVKDSDAVPKSYADSLKPGVQDPLTYSEDGKLALNMSTAVEAESALPVSAGAVYTALNSKSAVVLSVGAATAVSVSIAKGEIYAISYVTSYTSSGDILLKVNEAAPAVGCYSYSSSTSNYTGGIITYSGSTCSATFCGFIQVINGRVNVWGNGVRGNNTGHGWATAYWSAESVESLTFTRAGTLTLQKL